MGSIDMPCLKKTGKMPCFKEHTDIEDSKTVSISVQEKTMNQIVALKNLLQHISDLYERQPNEKIKKIYDKAWMILSEALSMMEVEFRGE